jgi:hypothetical protein
MTSLEPTPPRWADALLRSLSQRADRESIPGDLLEEYRAVRLPSVGAARANWWYVRQVLSVLWHLIRPWALTLAGVNVLRVLLGTIAPGVPFQYGLVGYLLWYGSLTQAPGVSLLDALIYLCAGLHASRRTGLIRTGIVAAGATSFVGLTVLFTAIAVRTPDLLRSPFLNPFIVVIPATLLLIAMAYAVLAGIVGAAVGKWTSPTVRRDVQVS